MALERIGLGGVLEFDGSQATRSMGQARDQFGRFVKTTDDSTAASNRLTASLGQLAAKANSFKGMGEGLGKIGGAIRSAGIAALPLSAGLGFAAEKAISFEKQMSAVGAVSRLSNEDFKMLGTEAKRLGASTVFTATQAAEGMELMGRSGATATQIMGGIGGVLNAASADSIDLATSADLVAQATNIMGRTWEQAANTADVLALGSAKANTDMIGLGEALKYGGQTARGAGIDFESTIGILGKLADAGLRGSSGGTALQNALNKLAQPSEKGAEFLSQLGVKMTLTKEGGVDLVDIVEQISKKLVKIKDPLQRTAIATEIFGMRGRRAYEALANAGSKATNELIDQLRNASDGIGAAAEMSQRRLDNVAGAWTLFQSAIEGASIAFFDTFLGPFKGFIDAMSTVINNVTAALTVLTNDTTDLEKHYDELFTVWMTGGQASVEIAYGILDAIDFLKQSINEIESTLTDTFALFGATFGGDTIRNITKFAVLFFVIGGLSVPIIGALYGIYYVISAVLIPAIDGLITFMLSFLFSPLGVALAGLTVLFLMIRRDGESVGDTLSRVWTAVQNGVERVWQAVQAFWNGIVSVVMPGITQLGAVWDETVMVIKQVIMDLANQWSSMTSDASVDWQEVGVIVGAIAMALVETFLRVFEYGTIAIGGVISLVMTLVSAILSNVIPVFGELYLSISGIIDAVSMMFNGQMIEGLKLFAKSVFDFVTIPLKGVLMQIISLADAVGAGGLVPDAIRGFALEKAQIGGNQEAGKNGLFDSVFGSGTPTARVAPEAGPSAAERDLTDLGKRALAAKTAREASQKVDVNVKTEVPPINIENKTQLDVDGRSLALATSRNKQELHERAGFKATPWQRRARVEHGSTPANRG